MRRKVLSQVCLTERGRGRTGRRSRKGERERVRERDGRKKEGKKERR